eukprot:118529_1
MADDQVEPKDSVGEREIMGSGSHYAPVSAADVDSDDPMERVPFESIPATGRGNSMDGQLWLNPSAAQIYRACKRNKKQLEEEDAPSMSLTHVNVTESTWSAIMDFEKLHSAECPNPKLARFWGMYGQHTIKSRLVHLMGGPYPFDRHDWVVDRCGKEVRYIIDYYAYPITDMHGNDDIQYSIDARPALTPSGVFDRFRVAFKNWKAGDAWW